MPYTGRPDGRRLPVEDQEDELDLIKYVVAVWRRRWIIAAVVVVSCTMAAVSTLRTPLAWSATTRLLVSSSKLAQDGAAVNLATYRLIVQTQTLADELVRTFGFDKPPHSMTGRAFIDNHVTVEPIGNGDALLLNVTLWDPEVAARAANHLAHNAVALAERLNLAAQVGARDIIKVHLDESRARLETADAELRKFKKTAQVELRRGEVDSLVQESRYMLWLDLDIEAERAALASAERQLKAAKPVISVTRPIDRDSAPAEVARQSPESGRLLPLQLQEEAVNPLYVVLSKQVADIRTKLAGLEGRRERLAKALKAGAAPNGPINMLYDREAQLTRLQGEFDLAEEAFNKVSNRYEQARLEVAGPTAQMQVLDTASPPQAPLSRQGRKKLLVAFIVSLALAVGAVVFTEYAVSNLIRTPRRAVSEV